MSSSFLKIFEDYMYASLPDSPSFEEFYNNFIAVLRKEQDNQMETINDYWNERARKCFAPIRTLFIDDCIDKGIGWFQGGARYTFSIHCDSGIPNTLDSLLAIKHLVFDKKRYLPEQFLLLLKSENAEF